MSCFTEHPFHFWAGNGGEGPGGLLVLSLWHTVDAILIEDMRCVCQPPFGYLLLWLAICLPSQLNSFLDGTTKFVFREEPQSRLCYLYDDQ